MIKCPVCGTSATESDIFCSNCGHRLQELSAVRQNIPDKHTQPPPPPMPDPPPNRSEPDVRRPSDQPVVIPGNAPPVQPATGQTPPPPPGRGQRGGSTQSSPPEKKKRKGCVVAVIGIGLLILCGLVVVGGIILLPELVPSLEPTATPYSDDSIQSDTEAPLDVVNNSDYTLCYLYISPSNSDEWGEDWLWEIGTIEPGFAATFYLQVGATYDLRAEDCNGELLDEQYDVAFPPEGLTYTLTP